LNDAERTGGVLDRDLAYQAALEDHQTLLAAPVGSAGACADRRLSLLGAGWMRAAGGEASRQAVREAALGGAGECAAMIACDEDREDLERRISQTAARIVAPAPV